MSPVVLFVLVLCLLLSLAALPSAAAETNLLKNGDFAIDTDGNGMGDQWAFSGDTTAVTATWRREPLPQGGYAQELICTHFVAGGADHHAMLAQYDTFALKRGKWYRLSFRVKGELPSTSMGCRLLGCSVGCLDWGVHGRAQVRSAGGSGTTCGRHRDAEESTPKYLTRG